MKIDPKKEEIEKAWSQAKSITKCSQVNGPIAAMIQQFRDLGWNPEKPNRWTKNEYLAIIGESPADDIQISTAMERDIENEIWKKAAHHYLGGGLEKGTPSFKQAEKARKKFIKEERFEEAQALDAVLAAGTWHHGRGESETI